MEKCFVVRAWKGGVRTTSSEGEIKSCAINNSDELASFGKSVGSNWFITDQKLSAIFKKAFNSVFLCTQENPEFFRNPHTHAGQG